VDFGAPKGAPFFGGFGGGNGEFIANGKLEMVRAPCVCGQNVAAYVDMTCLLSKGFAACLALNACSI
jgi:hypothetical protein